MGFFHSTRRLVGFITLDTSLGCSSLCWGVHHFWRFVGVFIFPSSSRLRGCCFIVWLFITLIVSFSSWQWKLIPLRTYHLAGVCIVGDSRIFCTLESSYSTKKKFVCLSLLAYSLYSKRNPPPPFVRHGLRWGFCIPETPKLHSEKLFIWL